MRALTHLPTATQYNKDQIITGRPNSVKSSYFSPNATNSLKRGFTESSRRFAAWD